MHVLVTPPAEEPVTLAEAKLWLRLDGPDEDALIESLIKTARTAAEDYTRRAFVTQTWKLTVEPSSGGRVPDWLPAGTYDLPVNYFDGDLPRSLRLPREPIQSVTGVLTYDPEDNDTAFTSYALDAPNLILTDAWPGNLRRYAAAEVTYVAGYGNASQVPEPIKTAIKMHVMAIYDSRTSCEMPPGCAQLLRQYRVL